MVLAVQVDTVEVSVVQVLVEVMAHQALVAVSVDQVLVAEVFLEVSAAMEVAMAHHMVTVFKMAQKDISSLNLS